MSLQKTVILTGAGAVIPWGAPKTEDIKEKLITDNTFRSYTGQPLGDWLYHNLIGLYHKDPQTVNFETIINAIEYLITFFSSKNRESTARYKNLMPAFFDEKDNFLEVLWFDRIYKKENDRWFSHNPRYKSYSFWNDYDYFFENVFRYFINVIVAHVEEYSRNSNNNTNLNGLLNEFLNFQNCNIRFYTTNYDRIIPAIYKGKIFEGFTEENGDNKFDLKKVLIEDDINTYYNIHGSVHYAMDFPNNVKYMPNEFIYDFGHSSSDKSDQDSKRLINSNIITGFNKSARILTNPYSQFYHRFYQDCLTTDKIFIIGYSFGDTHLNSAIKTASLVNEKLKIIWIDYFLCDDGIEVETPHDWIDIQGKYKNFLTRESPIFQIADRKNVDRIEIYRRGFQFFLERK